MCYQPQVRDLDTQIYNTLPHDLDKITKIIEVEDIVPRLLINELLGTLGG